MRGCDFDPAETSFVTAAACDASRFKQHDRKPPAGAFERKRKPRGPGTHYADIRVRWDVRCGILENHGEEYSVGDAAGDQSPKRFAA
jgi:hypothetical protein